MNFPKLVLPQFGLVSVVLAPHEPISQFLSCLAMTLPSHCCHWQTLPACCGFHLTTLLSFLLSYTPHLKATFCTFVTGRFHEDSSTASLCIDVYIGTGDAQMGDGICVSVATGLQPWQRERGKCIFPFAAADAGLILDALKLNLCVVKTVAERHYFKLH